MKALRPLVRNGFKTAHVLHAPAVVVNPQGRSSSHHHHTARATTAAAAGCASGKGSSSPPLGTDFGRSPPIRVLLHPSAVASQRRCTSLCCRCASFCASNGLAHQQYQSIISIRGIRVPGGRIPSGLSELNCRKKDANDPLAYAFVTRFSVVTWFTRSGTTRPISRTKRKADNSPRKHLLSALDNRSKCCFVAVQKNLNTRFIAVQRRTTHCSARARDPPPPAPCLPQPPHRLPRSQQECYALQRLLRSH